MARKTRIEFFADHADPRSLSDLGGTFENPEDNQSRGEHVRGSYAGCPDALEEDQRVACHCRRRHSAARISVLRSRRPEVQLEALGNDFVSPGLNPEERAIALGL